MLITTAPMAVPLVTSLQDCADFSKTVEPYIPQLYSLTNDILTSITSPEALKQIYISTNPVISGFAFSVFLMPIFLIVSEILQNYSQVDCCWSILPTVYHAHFAIWARLHGLPTQRVDNVLAFSVVWSIRLTYMYWRKGGYQFGSEDYRWAIIKRYIGPWGFLILNLLFISTVQSVLLFAVTTPTYILLLASRLDPTMTIVDSIFPRALLGLVVFEYFADGQQWNFQAAKKQYQSTAKVPQGWTRAQMDRGFITSGLWRYSRHPNFAAEQTIWIVLYQWGCWQSNTLYNWTVAGVIVYLGVFAGSTPLTEWISSGKYPEYAVYQERVGKFLPKLWGQRWDEKEMEERGPRLAEEKKKNDGKNK